MKTTLPQTRTLVLRVKIHQLSVLAICLLFLTLLGIPVPSSILLISSLLLCTSVGAAMTRNFSTDSDFVLPILVGLASLFTFSQLLILVGLESKVAHGLTVCGFAVFAAIQPRRFKSAIDPFIRFWTLKSALVITVLVLASFQCWLIPFSFSVLIADHLLSQTRIKRSGWLISGVFIALGSLWSLSIRPINWWYFFQGNDSQFFESISWSTSEWGVLEHPGLVGASLLDYHWLSYGILGSLSHVAILPQWDALMLFGPPFIMLLFSAVLLKQYRSSDTRLSIIPLMLIFIVVRSVATLRFESLGFSLVVAIVFLDLSSQTGTSSGRYKRVLLLSFLSIMLIFSKVSTAVIVNAILICWFLVLKFQKLDKRQLVIPVACLFCISILFYLTVFHTTSSNAIDIPSQVFWRASLIELRGLVENLSLVIQVAIILGLLKFVVKKDILFKPQVVAISVVSLLGLCAQVAFPSAKSSYFGAPSLTILVCLLAAHALKSGFGGIARFRLNNLSVLVLSMLGFLVGIYQDRLFARVATSTNFPMILGDFAWSIVQGSGFVIAIGLIAVLLATVNRHKTELILVGVITIFTGHLFGVGQRSFQNILNYGSTNYTNWADNAAPFGTIDLQLTSAFIRDHTKSDVIFASNNFCCFGSDWISDIEDDPELYAMKHSGETKWGGANYLLPAETRRRFLVQGVRFQTGHGVASNEQLKRLRLSVDFATAPSNEVLDALQNYGVTYFVVNLELTPKTDWSQFADSVFRSGPFLLLRLHRSDL